MLAAVLSVAMCVASAAASPMVGIISTSAPVAVSGEAFTFYASLSWTADSPDSYVYWRVCRDDGLACNHKIDDGRFNATEDGALLQELSSDISDKKIGKHHYHLVLSLDPTFPEDDCSVSSFLMKVVPGAVTLVPPIITVLVAVTTRNVLLSLFTGIYFAALIIWNFNVRFFLPHFLLYLPSSPLTPSLCNYSRSTPSLTRSPS